jgi:hypothetical protein
MLLVSAGLFDDLPRFLRHIEQARSSMRAGRRVRLEDLEERKPASRFRRKSNSNIIV